MATGAIQLSIGLIDGMLIPTVSSRRHSSRDHPVSKGHQIDTKQFCSALYPFLRTAFREVPFRILPFENMKRVLPNSGGATKRISARGQKGVDSGMFGSVTVIAHPGRLGFVILVGSVGRRGLVKPSSPCEPPIMNCIRVGPAARKPRRPTRVSVCPPTKA